MSRSSCSFQARSSTNHATLVPMVCTHKETPLPSCILTRNMTHLASSSGARLLRHRNDLAALLGHSPYALLCPCGTCGALSAHQDPPWSRQSLPLHPARDNGMPSVQVLYAKGWVEIAPKACRAILRAATSEDLVAPNLVRRLLLHGILQSSCVWLLEHRALTPCMLSF